VARLWAARGVSVDPSRIALTASTSEAYAFLFKLLCDPGDAVLVPRPSYPLFEHLARYEGIEAVPYLLDYDGAWHIDGQRVRAAITPRTRAIVALSPNNPTGSYLKRDELEGLAALGLPIISDEVFAEYPLSDDTRRAQSALAAEDVLVFALDGLSKRAALPQLKLGWITASGPRRLVEDALRGLEHVCDAFLSPGASVQHALPLLLALSASSRRAILARARDNHATLARLTAGSAVTPLAAEGGWYAVARLPSVRTEEAWVEGLLEERDVLVQPGFFYDFVGEAFVVVSLLTPEAEFFEGVSRLVEYVASAT
jgi:aspartate/methionine/tyrosine aminotransferase